MTGISAEQLDHLAMLSALNISDKEKEVLLPHLEQILWFVGQLENCDIEGVEVSPSVHDDATLPCREGIEDCGLREEFLANVQHPVHDGAIEIKSMLN